MLTSKLKQKLAQQTELGLLRQRMVADDITTTQLSIAGKQYLNFASNDYLGIACDSNAQTHLSERLSNQPLSSGAMASPLVVGRHQVHHELENLLLEWVNAPKNYGCLLFGSGFSANTGVISALFNEKSSNALLVQDKLNHASLMDAGKHAQALGHCRQQRFLHNDLDSLDGILQKPHTASANTNGDTADNKLVVTEGVFSMDGDQPDLQKTSELAKTNNAWFMLDDAHGIGIHGKQGSGSLSAQGISISQCDVLVITFGKAIGAQGAAVIASQQTIDYLTNFSREYIYSTHLSPLQTAAVIANIQTIKQDQWRRDKLAENIEYFKQKMQHSNYSLLPSNSPIQPIIIGDEAKAMQLSQKLKDAGVWASAMRYPTVAKQQARLRVTITAAHTKQHVDALVKQVMA